MFVSLSRKSYWTIWIKYGKEIDYSLELHIYTAFYPNIMLMWDNIDFNASEGAAKS